MPAGAHVAALIQITVMWPGLLLTSHLSRLGSPTHARGAPGCPISIGGRWQGRADCVKKLHRCRRDLVGTAALR